MSRKVDCATEISEAQATGAFWTLVSLGVIISLYLIGSNLYLKYENLVSDTHSNSLVISKIIGCKSRYQKEMKVLETNYYDGLSKTEKEYHKYLESRSSVKEVFLNCLFYFDLTEYTTYE